MRYMFLARSGSSLSITIFLPIGTSCYVDNICRFVDKGVYLSMSDTAKLTILS